MIKSTQPMVFIAEDDADDRMLIEEALLEHNEHMSIRFANDGQELIEMLGAIESLNGGTGFPHVIILDLNMPRVDGLQALKFIKEHKLLKRIPTLILTTSGASLDIDSSYEMGANSFITKPSDFNEMVGIGKLLSDYWFQTVELPLS